MVPIRIAASEYNRNKGTIFMVFEYMQHDLTGLIDNPQVRCLGRVRGQHSISWQQACSGSIHTVSSEAVHEADAEARGLHAPSGDDPRGRESPLIHMYPF